VLGAIRVARPDLLKRASVSETPGSVGNMIAYGVVAAFGLVLFVSPFASEWPDGLETVASRLGFSQQSLHHVPIPQPLSDYSFPGLGSSAVSTIVAGTLGVAAALVLMVLLARVLRSRS
jgi:hypothetical protein